VVIGVPIPLYGRVFQPDEGIFGKGSGTMLFPAYVQPVAYHRDFTHRLLLKDEAGNWFLWQGDGSSLVEIDQSLAGWIYDRPEIYPMAGEAIWFEVSSLPVAADSSPISGD
jgi:hypothetical protein